MVSKKLTNIPYNVKSYLKCIKFYRRQWRRSGIFGVDFEHISHLVLVFLLKTLNM